MHCRFCGGEIIIDSKYCSHCGKNLEVPQEVGIENTLFLHDAKISKKKKPVLFKIGFGIAISSIFLSFIGLIPLTGIVVNLCALIYFDKKEHTGIWMPILGFLISALYMLVNAHENGHLDRFVH